ncbi:type II toxin-antitoxin system VapC family toxin [uncultured Sphingomonas sp.]|uniref:type II toxin-antitoxin system VapC family toxin n=1 Tax=uncultured Sphingomonas sp. TaxID=158754 RepID=UPI0025D90118|nr:type II toxin-antitoxin system VapC family toxin [uncultured Sphingomonas sp.]
MIVLDTHALIWAVRDDRNLGQNARAIINDATRTTGLIVPAFCAWEIAQIKRRQNLTFEGGVLAWFRRILAEPGFRLSPLVPEIAVGSVMLDWQHKDAADRIMVATAQYHDMALLTADEPILRYAADGNVKAIDARR